MRIISGRFKGMRLHGLPKNVAGVRPSMDIVKEGIFSVLFSHIAFHDTEVLDLYAGSGSYGFESLSRGARRVVFVDKFKGSTETIRNNIKLLGVESSAELIKSTVTDFLSNTQRKWQKDYRFDVVFADPPYGQVSLLLFLDTLKKSGFIKKGSIVIFEDQFSNLDRYLDTQNWQELSEVNFACLKVKKYSQSGVVFMEYKDV